MKSDAPGKLVISGAYSVLLGAPALVAAVDRRVYADTAQGSNYESKEVTCGLALLAANPKYTLSAPLARPWYDARQLRGARDKLGLGSSAAICVASLALTLSQLTHHNILSPSSEQEAERFRRSLLDKLYPLALAAHREAQGGGSGIDVAAACYGGFFSARLDSKSNESSPLAITRVSLPSSLCLEVWASPNPATTSEFVRAVMNQRTQQPRQFQFLMHDQMQASENALEAVNQSDSSALVSALRQQLVALKKIGQLAQVSIVESVVSILNNVLDTDCVFLPSGAGGGDITLYAGPHPSPPEFRKKALGMNLRRLDLQLGAPGLQLHWDIK